MQAIDYAKQKLSESFLFPKNLITAKQFQFNAEIIDEKLHLNGKETAWIKDLNEEQKEAVAIALRGECRPLPLIIFGPPVRRLYTILVFITILHSVWSVQ